MTSNSMTVTTIRQPIRYREEASRHGQGNQNDNNQDIDIQTDQQHTLAPSRRQRDTTDNRADQNIEIHDFDDTDDVDEKTPRWMNRFIRNQDRNMSTLTNLLNNRLSRTDNDDYTNRVETRKREFNKYIEKLRIEHDLKTKFQFMLGKKRMTDVEAQVLQIE